MTNLEQLLIKAISCLPESLQVIADADPEFAAAMTDQYKLALWVLNLHTRLATADGIIRKLIPTVRPSQRSSEVYLRACQYLQDTQADV